MHVRRKLVAGNWKMNGGIAQLSELSVIAKAAREASGVDVAICPPFTLIAPAVTRSGGLVIGAQDVHSRRFAGGSPDRGKFAQLGDAAIHLPVAGDELATDVHDLTIPPV